MSASPSTAASATDLVRQADALLCADRQFGDSAAIAERNLARFRLGLTMLARQDGAGAGVLRATAAADDDDLRPLLYDPVLRNCFEVDLVHRERGELTHSAFAAHVTDLPTGPASDATWVDGPCAALTRPRLRAWPGRGDAWVLTGLEPHGGAQEKLAGRLRELYRDAIGAPDAPGPVLPTEDMRAALRDGAELLATLLPSAGAGVLGHVTMVGFTHRESEEGPLQSMSGGDPLPSTVLLAPERCASPWLVAESLLHEGAHLKLFDALRTGALVGNPTERVPIPWRIGEWTLIRVFVALHFYVHLLALHAAGAHAGQAVRDRFGPPPSAEEIDEPSPGTPAALEGTYRTSAERARHLARCVLSLPAQALTGHGHRFARWLLTALRLLDPQAPAPPERSPLPTGHDGSGQVADAGPGGALEQTRPVDACALPRLGQLVVSTPHSPRMHWLNARSWTVYALCDGRDLGALRSAYARAAGLPADSERVDRQVGESLEQLLAVGLVTRGG